MWFKFLRYPGVSYNEPLFGILKVHMKKIIVSVVLGAMLWVPVSASAAQTTQEAQIAQLQQLIIELQSMLAKLLAKKPTAAPSSSVLAYDVQDVKQITYQEVISVARGKQGMTHRYEVLLHSGQKIVVVSSPGERIAERLKDFKSSGFRGSDLKALLKKADLLPTIEKQTCKLAADKSVYEAGETIILKWEADRPYVAFNAYGSSNGKNYVDDVWRDANGSVAIKITDIGKHRLYMHVSPTKEPFLTDSCNVVIEVVQNKNDVKKPELPDDPELVHFTVDAQTAVKKTDIVTISYRVEKTPKCTLSAEKGANKLVIYSPGKSITAKAPVPAWAEVGSSYEYVLRCDSHGNAYYGPRTDSLKKSITVSVTE